MKGTPDKYLNNKEGDCLIVKPVLKVSNYSTHFLFIFHSLNFFVVDIFAYTNNSFSMQHDDGSWLVQVDGTINDVPIDTCKKVKDCINKNILADNVYTEVNYKTALMFSILLVLNFVSFCTFLCLKFLW